MFAAAVFGQCILAGYTGWHSVVVFKLSELVIRSCY